MELLQLKISGFQDAFIQYGILGIAVLLLGYLAWGTYQRLLKKNEALEQKVDSLQNEIDVLLVEERDRLIKIVEDNTRAIENLTNILVQSLINRNQ